MQKSKLATIFFWISFATGILSSILSFTNLGINKLFFMIAIVSFIIYVIPVLMEIYSSKKINLSEKLMWTVGFIILNNFTGLFYFLIARRRIYPEYKLLSNI